MNAGGDLLVTINGVTTTYTTIAGDSIESINVLGLAGSDALTVDSTNGAIPIPITFDGGESSDSLTLTGGTATSDIYTSGPNPGQGTSTIVIGGVTQTVRFSNLEPVIDLVAGPLVVNATNADNAINYTQGSVAANGRVSIDSFETIEFSNKTTLTINGLAGSDTITLDNADTPTGLTGVTVDAGSGTDAIEAFGTVATDTINYSVTGLGTATLAINALPLYTLSGIEGVTVDGRASNSSPVAGDQLTITTQAGGRDDIILTPGPVNDSGTVEILSLPNSVTYPPLTYRNLDPVGGQLFLVDAGGLREDRLVYRGTPGDDRFFVEEGLTGDGLVELQVGFGQSFFVSTPGVATVEVEGLGGDDFFRVPAFANPLPFEVRAIGSSGADSVEFSTLDGSPNVAVSGLSTNLVSVQGGGLALLGMQLIGVELFDVFNFDNTIGITLQGSVLDVTPTSATSATTLAQGAFPITVNVDTPGAFTLNGNTLTVCATTAADIIDVAPSSVVVDNDGVAGAPTLLPINFNADLASLAVFGDTGSDIFNITPSAATPILPRRRRSDRRPAGRSHQHRRPRHAQRRPGERRGQPGDRGQPPGQLRPYRVDHHHRPRPRRRPRDHQRHQRQRRHHHHCP